MIQYTVSRNQLSKLSLAKAANRAIETPAQRQRVLVSPLPTSSRSASALAWPRESIPEHGGEEQEAAARILLKRSPSRTAMMDRESARPVTTSRGAAPALLPTRAE